MRIKKMPEEQFHAVMALQWAPVQLIEDAIPDLLQNLPRSLMPYVYASGTFDQGIEYAGDELIPSGELIGGIDVYRAAPDDPVEFNKDWYPVIRPADMDGYLLVTGPWKDAEHWLDEIPRRLTGVQILGVPPLPSGT